MTTTRCGLIAVIGAPNAGKSTLINHLAGGKVSIVSPKAQTTRFRVRGVCIHAAAQLVFIDTPGIFDASEAFERQMVQSAWAGVADADAVLMLLDARRGLDGKAVHIIEQLHNVCKKPASLALNKVDAVEHKPGLLALAARCNPFGQFEHVFMISARSGEGVSALKDHLAGCMPEGPWLYPEDHMSDIPQRLLAAEITREKVFFLLNEELPYAIGVETESWQDGQALTRIAQVILVQRDGQKKIVIGDKGAMIRQIGTQSRMELERLLGRKVHLELFVKVQPDWKSKREHLQPLGT